MDILLFILLYIKDLLFIINSPILHADFLNFYSMSFPCSGIPSKTHHYILWSFLKLFLNELFTFSNWGYQVSVFTEYSSCLRNVCLLALFLIFYWLKVKVTRSKHLLDEEGRAASIPKAACLCLGTWKFLVIMAMADSGSPYH